MNYELAKELKEAGFPQREFRFENGYLGKWPTDIAPYKFPYNPPLSELIEKCTLNQYNFSLGSGIVVGEESFVWTAKTRGEEGRGYSKEEAVARLFLSLNKKSPAPSTPKER